MSRAGELVLATLWLAPDAARTGRLSRAAAAVDDWPAALLALEAHGVLGLARRNFTLAEVRLPEEAAAALEARHAVLRRIELGFRLTLERYLAAARTRGVRVTLLKGASLARDLYGPGALRASGDLDLLVAPDDVPAAVEAALAIGLGEPRGALPAWWYRLFHFHRKFVAQDAWQRELELHWDLHHASARLAVRPADLLARRVPVEGEAGVFALDPLDRFLHLATHLARHADLAGMDAEELARQCGDARAPLRAKWLLDLGAELELRRFESAALLARAREWNAAEELAAVLGVLVDGSGLETGAAARARALLAELPPLAAARRHARRVEALPGFDLRPSALALLPRWMWPSAGRFAGLAPRGPAGLARLAHVVRVLARVLLGLLLTPPAWLLRHRRWTGRALPPAEVLGLVARARALEKGA